MQSARKVPMAVFALAVTMVRVMVDTTVVTLMGSAGEEMIG